MCAPSLLVTAGLVLHPTLSNTCARPPCPPQSLVFPIISILGITGLYGFIMIRVPLTPDEFRIGAALFCVVPTTLTMGVTLVTQGNGNSALALLLTAGTNILGVGTTPFLFQAILNTATSGAKSTLNPIQLLIKLVTVVLGPCLIGKVRHAMGGRGTALVALRGRLGWHVATLPFRTARANPTQSGGPATVRAETSSRPSHACHPSPAPQAARDLIPFVLKFANERKIAIGLTVNFFLIWIVWMSVSKAQHKFVTTPPKDIIVAALAMVALHLVWLAMNAAFCYILRLNKVTAGDRGLSGVLEVDAARLARAQQPTQYRQTTPILVAHCFHSPPSPQRDFRCCVILPSQKALPVVLTVVSFLPKELGNHGLMAIPPTVVYVAQLLIDSAVVAWWLAQASEGCRWQQLH